MLSFVTLKQRRKKMAFNYKSNVTVPLEIILIEDIDQLAFEQNLSRAAYIRQAAKEKVKRDKEQKNLK